MTTYHESVLLQEVVHYLNIAAGKRVVDATAGDGGHSIGIAKSGGKVLALDRDEKSVKRFTQRLKTFPAEIRSRVQIIESRFSNIGKVVRTCDFYPVDGVLFDFGLSSYQLSESSRGFSFHDSSYLDMRMDTTTQTTAADIVSSLNEEQLASLFIHYGEEPLAKIIARRIVQERKKRQLDIASNLAEFIKEIYENEKQGKKHTPSIHPATRVFQALRIAVNDEFSEIDRGLQDSLGILRVGGRLVTVSFHSLEDRIVKNFIRSHSELKNLTKDPIRAGEREVLDNPRSRSAKLRAAEKL